MRTQFSINQIIVLGNITNDPVVKTTDGGTLIINFNLATNRSVKIAEGNYEDKPTFHRIVCIGKGAEWLENRLKKGQKILVQGRQENRSYESDGVKKYVSEIIADGVTPFLSSSKKNNDGDDDLTENVKESLIADEVSDDVPF